MATNTDHRQIISGYVVYELPGGFVKIEGQMPMSKTEAETFLREAGGTQVADIECHEAAMREQTRRRLVNKIASGPEPDQNAGRTV